MTPINSSFYRPASAVFSLTLLGACAILQNQPRNWEPVLRNVRQVQNEVRLPIQPIPSGRSGIDFIGVEVQSQERPLLALLDTGTSLTILRESVRPEVRIRKVTKGEGTDGFEEQLPTTIFSTSSLYVGGEALESEPVIFLPDEQFDSLTRAEGRKIDGILGATLLSRGEVEFDPRERTLTIRPFGAGRLEEGPHTVPLLKIPDLNGYTVPLETEEGRRARFILDTGTNADLILAEESDLGKKAKQVGASGSTQCRTLRGENLVGSHPLPLTLRIATQRFEKGIPVFVQPRPEPRFEGSLGIPVFWASERVILNQELGLILFQPRQSSPIS